MDRLGEKTSLTCPECGGIVWNLKNEPIARYRCHTGHSFTTRALLDGQAETIEFSLWSAVRMMDERVKIINSMVESDKESGRTRSIASYEKKIKELQNHSKIIRNFIMSGLLTAAISTQEDKNSSHSL